VAQGVVWVDPADGGLSVDFPTGIGVTQCFMEPETKSNHSQMADVVANIGRWLQRVRLSSGKDHNLSKDC
jgi:hypothetical protein